MKIIQLSRLCEHIQSSDFLGVNVNRLQTYIIVLKFINTIDTLLGKGVLKCCNIYVEKKL